MSYLDTGTAGRVPRRGASRRPQQRPPQRRTAARRGSDFDWKKLLIPILAAIAAIIVIFVILHWPKHYDQDCYLAVVVTDMESNSILSDAQVTVKCTSSKEETLYTADYWDDEEYYYTIITGGDYLITVVHDGYERLEVPIKVQDQEVFYVKTSIETQ